LPDSSLAGQEHGRTIPLADIRVFFEASTKAARVRLFGELRLFCANK
jgi:hypothetical protein